jgi:carboxyl-terminal processing protease
MRHSAKVSIPAFLPALAGAFAALCLPSTLPAADDLAAQMKRVIDAYALVEQNAAEPVDSKLAFYQGAIPGLLHKLDPHSNFFDPDQFEQLKRLETSTEKGFGTVVSVVPGRITVLQSLPGTPSAKAGLAPGDDIVAVNGYAVSQLDLDGISELLAASRRQKAQLVVRHAGEGHLAELTLAPEEMASSSVDRAYFLAAGIGYIRITSFEDKTGTELKEAIEKLGGDRLQGLVLDLRNNPGGLVSAALDTAALFLKPGQSVVTIKGRRVESKDEFTPAFATPYTFKLAVLINEKTASASEIVSGALQDHDRASIIGEDSYGKGLVQSVFPVSEETGLALTTGLYYTPSGRSIQKPLDASRYELASATAPTTAKKAGQYHTDGGRKVTGGGGIKPDFRVTPARLTRLQTVLDGSGAFTDFATVYRRTVTVDEDFEVTPAVLDAFHAFLVERNIQPSVSEWTSIRKYVSIRLKAEIFNQTLGLEKGDQVDAERDTVISKALAVLGS